MVAAEVVDDGAAVLVTLEADDETFDRIWDHSDQGADEVEA